MQLENGPESSKFNVSLDHIHFMLYESSMLVIFFLSLMLVFFYYMYVQCSFRNIGYPLFSSYQVLDLHDNFITALPADIDELKSLQVNNKAVN